MSNDNLSTSPSFLTTKQAAALLGVHISWFHRDRARDVPRIPFHRFGHSIRYSQSDIEAYINASRVAVDVQGEEGPHDADQ